MLPNFLLVGAARCGTTSLYYYLMQHPEISMPDLKEPKYFSSIDIKFPQNGIGDQNIDAYIIKNLEEYESLFANISNVRVGEASPDYLFYSNYTANHIRNTLGDIPIIIIVRNPVERAKSSYKYLTREGREFLSFNDAINQEEGRLRNNWDFMWAHKEYGLYYYRVMDFMSTFTNVNVIVYEEFVKDSSKYMANVFKFLSVDHEYKIDTRIVHNSSGKPNYLGNLVLNRKSKISTHIRELLKSTIPRNVLEYVANKAMSKIEISDEADKELCAYYEEDVRKMSELLKKNLGELWFGK